MTDLTTEQETKLAELLNCEIGWNPNTGKDVPIITIDRLLAHCQNRKWGVVLSVDATGSPQVRVWKPSPSGYDQWRIDGDPTQARNPLTALSLAVLAAAELEATNGHR